MLVFSFVIFDLSTRGFLCVVSINGSVCLMQIKKLFLGVAGNWVLAALAVRGLN